MSLLSLIFQQSVKAQIGIMQLDASLNETHERSSTITDHEIEDGTNINDHIRKLPEKLTIQGLISDSPVTLIGSIVGTGISSLSGGVGQILPGGFGSIASIAAGIGLGSIASLVTGSPRDPADSFKYLEELWNDRQLFTVVTALRKYDDMAIESLIVPRSATVGKSLEFTIQMKKIRRVQSAIVVVPTFKTRNQGSSTKSKRGKQAGKTTEDQSASLIAQAYDKGKEIVAGLF